MTVKTSITSLIKEKKTKKISIGFPKAPRTTLTVIIDVGFENQLYIRGTGAGLKWDQGILLKNRGPNQWIWESDKAFDSCYFKVLINDQNFEIGKDHYIECGEKRSYSPVFTS
ncbi:MAG: hypothetical protein CMO81_03595 [Waddliaceae bacterium]|nr:hypothetical protein [Waddliaceae bacterium]